MSKRKNRDGYSERLSVSFTAEQMRRLEEILRVRARQGEMQHKTDVIRDAVNLYLSHQDDIPGTRAAITRKLEGRLDSTTIGFTPTPEDQSTIERAITQIQDALAANVDIIKQEAVDANVWELFSSPEAIFNYSVVVVVDVLKTMIDTALVLIEAGIDLIFDLISDILGILDTVMKSRIYIPFVTNLYESVISPGNTLNLYSLFALLGAAPFTITYKTLKGHKPFDEQALEASRQLSPANYRMMLASTSRKKSSPSPYLPLVIVSNGLAFVASGAMIAASGLATLDGLAQGSVLTFARWKVAAELVIQLCGTPIYLGDSTGNFQTSLYDSLIWVSQFIPLLLDGASVVTDSTGNLAQTFFKTFSDIVKPGGNIRIWYILCVRVPRTGDR